MLIGVEYATNIFVLNVLLNILAFMRVARM